MIFLKYSESFSKRKKHFGTGFYTVIACCLILIGAAAWFALDKLQEPSKTTSPETKNYNSENIEYKDNSSSYIETVPENFATESPKEDVKKEITNEPYNTESSVSKKENNIVFSMPVEGEIIKEHSEKTLQFSSTYGDMRIHTGIDISCNADSPIFACGDGVVKGVENDTEYGKIVIIQHNNSITIKYAALKDVTVKQGDSVKMGDTLGYSTTIPSECNDKNHIHIEAYKNGKQISPLEALGLN